MSHIHHQKLVVLLILAGVVWTLIALFSNIHQIFGSILHISTKRMLIVLGLSSFNYWIRIIRFNFFTRRVAVRPIQKDLNSLIFFSGLSMNLTPARVGEVVKAYFQRQFFKESFARMAPIVFIERLTDALAMLVMMSLGVLALKLGLAIFLFVIFITLMIIFVLHQRQLNEKITSLFEKFPLTRKLTKPLHRVLQASYRLTSFVPIAYGTFLGVVAWAAEAAGLWTLIGSTNIPLTISNLYLSFFIFAAAAAAGFVSILPAGLGVNELSTIGLLEKLIGVSSPDAIAITFAFRIVTLWFGIFLGLVSLVYLERRVPS